MCSAGRIPGKKYRHMCNRCTLRHRHYLEAWAPCPPLIIRCAMKRAPVICVALQDDVSIENRKPLHACMRSSGTNSSLVVHGCSAQGSAMSSTVVSLTCQVANATMWQVVVGLHVFSDLCTCAACPDNSPPHARALAEQHYMPCMCVAAEGTNIRYGKYCGVGHSGCEGEKPCDPVDACCK